MSNIISQVVIKKKKSGKYVPHSLEETYLGQTKIIPIQAISIHDAYQALNGNDQIREGGIVSSHVSALLGSIERSGQRQPITIERDGSGNVASIPNGSGRVKAVYSLWCDANPKDKTKYSTIMAVELPWSFSRNADKELYQLALNEPLPVKANAVDDYAAHIKRHIGILALTATVKQEQNYIKKVEKYCKKNWSALRNKVHQRILKKVLNGKSNSKLDNYAPKGVAQLVRESCAAGVLGFNWQGRNPGDESNDAYLYAASRTSQITGPNVFGGIFNKLAKECKEVDYKNGRSKRFAVAIWESDTIGTTYDDIDKHREKMIKNINAVNKGWFLKGSYLPAGMITNVLLVPQKVTGGHKENPKKVVECPIDKNGNFILTGHKTHDDLNTGWK